MTTENHKCVCSHLGRWFILAVVLVLALGVLSWATMEQRKNILQTAKEMKECETFVQCAEKAGLTGVLEKDGPFTVFIPTNDAFKNMSQDELTGFLNNKSALTTLLLYHLVPQQMTPAQMGNLKDCMTCTVPQTAISCSENSFGKAQCVKSEIPCTNGVIYIIDAVQVPPFLTDQPEVVEEAEISVVETAPAATPAATPTNGSTEKKTETAKESQTTAPTEKTNEPAPTSESKTSDEEKTPETK